MHLLVPLLVALPALVLAQGYNNPIIPGFAPDPSCIRVDNRYFCVTSSFSAFPGIPVYTSTDLVQWEQIGNVLSRSTQLPDFVNVNTNGGGIWAATIRLHNGTYYVSTTLVRDNFPITDTRIWQNVSLSATSTCHSATQPLLDHLQDHRPIWR
jgi:beta-xylosidase